MPVETSSFMRSVACSNTELPVAPATDCIASTKGTPAANIVAKVRANLAIADFSKIAPITGILERTYLDRVVNATERFLALINANTAAPIPSKTNHQYFCINSDRLITICVNAGRSAPKP